MFTILLFCQPPSFLFLFGLIDLNISELGGNSGVRFSPGRGGVEGVGLPSITKAGQVNMALSQRGQGGDIIFTIVNGTTAAKC